MALALDASSPARFENFAGPSSITSASFTAPANAVLVATVEGAGNITTITVTDSGGLTWTTRVAKQLTSTSGAWVYVATAATTSSVARTVTVTFNTALSIGATCKVDVWTGANTASPVGATNSGNSAANPLNVGLTTLNANSRVIGCAVELKGLAGLTSTDTKDQSGVASAIRVYKATDTASPSAVTVNYSVTSGTPEWAWAAIELKAAASAPGAPTGLTAGTVGATTIPLSWTAPASDGGSSITDYLIEQRVGAYPATSSQAGAPAQLTAVDAVAGTAFVQRFTGSGVRVYVIGSGVRSTHTEFTGRIGTGYGVGGLDPLTDTNGHDTGTSSLALGTTMGVAKAATLIPVRIVTTASAGVAIDVTAMLDGLAWILANAVTPCVVSCSMAGYLAGEADSAGHTITSTDVTNITNAFNALYSAGIAVCVAAGNSGGTYNKAPQNIANMINCGNVDAVTLAKSSTSSFGSLIDIWAPGSGTGTVEAGIASDSDTVTNYDGTSESAPIVAGTIACMLQADPTLTPAQILTLLTGSQALTTGSVGSGSPTILVNSNTDPIAWTTYTDGTSTSTSTTVTGLTAATTYSYRVSAINAIGTGSASATVTATTGTAAPRRDRRRLNPAIMRRR